MPHGRRRWRPAGQTPRRRAHCPLRRQDPPALSRRRPLLPGRGPSRWLRRPAPGRPPRPPPRGVRAQDRECMPDRARRRVPAGCLNRCAVASRRAVWPTELCEPQRGRCDARSAGGPVPEICDLERGRTPSGTTMPPGSSSSPCMSGTGAAKAQPPGLSVGSGPRLVRNCWSGVGDQCAEVGWTAQSGLRCNRIARKAPDGPRPRSDAFFRAPGGSRVSECGPCRGVDGRSLSLDRN